MRKPVLFVVHGRDSRAGQVAAALGAKGWPTERCCPRAGDALPARPDAYAGAVMFGGPMSANDEHLDFIRAELDWIPAALDSGTPFLGICLGAQMLARALGAAVGPHPDGLFEVGYYPVTPTPEADGLFPGPMHVYHWHGEGFEVPAGADLLLTGETFPNQAFRYGDRAYAVQFHPEMQAETLKLWLGEAWDKRARPGAKPPAAQVAGHARHGPAMHRWLDDFLDVWLDGSD